MITLEGYIHDATGTPVASGTVELWQAVTGTPTGAPLYSASISGGRWTVSVDEAKLYDIKITVGTQVAWIKGLTKANLSELRVDTLRATTIVGSATPASHSHASHTGIGADDHHNKVHNHTSDAEGGSLNLSAYARGQVANTRIVWGQQSGNWAEGTEITVNFGLTFTQTPLFIPYVTDGQRGSAQITSLTTTQAKFKGYTTYAGAPFTYYAWVAIGPA